MLSDKALEEASILSRELSAKGVILKVRSDSPLFSICSDSTPMNQIYANFNEIVMAVKRASADKGLEGKSEHKVDLNNVASVLSQTLNTAVNVARNVINPFVKEIVEEINKRTSDVLYFNKGVTIKPVFKPKIFTSGKLDDLTEKYKNSLITPVNMSPYDWPTMDSKVLREAAKGGIGGSKTEIEDLLNNTTDEELIDIYNNIFKSGFLTDNVYDDNKVYIFGFLWANYWLVNIPEGTNMNLNDLKINLTNIKANCGKYIQNALNRFERMSAQGNFVLKVPNDNDLVKVMIVEGEIYNKWLKEGGSPETLIGAWLTDKVTTFGVIDDKQRTRWLRRYKLDNDLRRQHYEARKETITAKVLSDEVDEKINEENLNKEVIRERFNRLMKQKPFSAKGNVYKWVRMIVCKCFYPDSDILKILMKMDETLEANPEQPVREAATVASVDIIIDWILSAVNVGYIQRL